MREIGEENPVNENPEREWVKGNREGNRRTGAANVHPQRKQNIERGKALDSLQNVTVGPRDTSDFEMNKDNRAATKQQISRQHRINDRQVSLSSCWLSRWITARMIKVLYRYFMKLKYMKGNANLVS